MQILAAQNIPFVREIFAQYGDVHIMDGRKIENQHLKEIDVLLIRSTTQLDQGLLSNTNVRFVGSATAGCDHVDLDYLRQSGIQFANAPGSNANSVAEYVLSAIAELYKRGQLDICNKTLGIIGFGYVGTRLKMLLDFIGIDTIVYDPLLKQDMSIAKFVSLSEVLQADIITLHVPLVYDGPYPTYHMIGKRELNQLKPDVVLINTSRGPVIDNNALRQSLKREPRSVVLDVWESEPVIDIDLLDSIALATPHIAGHSIDGKIKGVEMIYRAFCQCFAYQTSYQFEQANKTKHFIDAHSLDKQALLAEAVLLSYDIRNDDAEFRKIKEKKPLDQRDYFDALRKNYSNHVEFSNVCLQIDHNEDTSFLKHLGFEVS